MTRIIGIERLSVTAHDALGLSRFYLETFGFRLRSERRYTAIESAALMDVECAATAIELGLGDETLELVQFDEPGRAYPHDMTSNDPAFQHFAIVVSDMAAAYAQVSASSGWSPITRDGPQRLPANTGGVQAFKFAIPKDIRSNCSGFRRIGCRANGGWTLRRIFVSALITPPSLLPRPQKAAPFTKRSVFLARAGR